MPNLSAMCKGPGEARSFQFFLERTVQELEGPFQDAPWARLLVQIAQAEPSINHALFALSGFHETYRNMRLAGRSESPFALNQYNLAIHALVKAPNRPASPTIHLVSCLIFFMIEVSLGVVRWHKILTK